VIHKECLCSEDPKDQSAIEILKNLEKNIGTDSIKYISADDGDGGFPFELEVPNSFGEVDKKKVFKTVHGFDLIILYGVRRATCLEYAANAIMDEGISVAYNILGTA
jgi:hypothetical protein